MKLYCFYTMNSHLIAVANSALKLVALQCVGLGPTDTTKLWNLTLSHINNVFDKDLPNEVLTTIALEKENVAFEWDEFLYYMGIDSTRYQRTVFLDEPEKCVIGNACISDSIDYLVESALCFYTKKLTHLHYAHVDNTDPDIGLHNLKDEFTIFVTEHIPNVYDTMDSFDNNNQRIKNAIKRFNERYENYIKDTVNYIASDDDFDE